MRSQQIRRRTLLLFACAAAGLDPPITVHDHDAEQGVRGFIGTGREWDRHRSRGGRGGTGVAGSGRKPADGNREARGYSRDLFHHWIDADRNGCSTRNEVLLEETVEAPLIEGRCKLSKGRWFSYYDAVTVEGPSKLDIDHLMPLAEAWRSGAHAWTTSQRQSFASDLTRPQLWAVTDNDNQAKGDKDPSAWKPSLTGFWCTYAKSGSPPNTTRTSSSKAARRLP